MISPPFWILTRLVGVIQRRNELIILNSAGGFRFVFGSRFGGQDLIGNILENRRQEWKGPRGFLFNQRPLIGD